MLYCWRKEAGMQKIAQDIADFRELRKKEFVYVDKTEPLYRLVEGG